jgi:hypothetical protein
MYYIHIIFHILLDSVMGKFRAILYLSILYAVGQIILAVGAVRNVILMTYFFVRQESLVIITMNGRSLNHSLDIGLPLQRVFTLSYDRTDPDHFEACLKK